MTIHKLLRLASNGSTEAADIDIPTGGGGSGNAGQVEVDFGFAGGGEGDSATASVSAAWVTSGSIITCSPSGAATADHSADDYALDGIIAYATNLQAGIGFDVVAKAINGGWGRYLINWIGV